MKILPIPALSDNYIWVLEKDKRIVVVDPGESELLLSYMEKEGLSLEAIMLTHSHPDHIGGVEGLASRYPVPIYGPKETGLVTDILSGGEEIKLLGETFQVIATPGHTEGHVVYLKGKDLFCGDVLFLSSCGRVFSGDYDAMFESLQKLKALEDDVKVYAAHEYSLSNLKQSVKYLDTPAVHAALDRVKKLREEGSVTLPTTIGEEKKINPFLVIDNVEDFKAYRKYRDQA